MTIYVPDISHDTVIIFSYLRILYDIVDSQTITEDEKRNYLDVSREFVDQLFSNRKIDGYFRWHEIESERPEINWEYFAKHFNDEELATMRSVHRVARCLPQELFHRFLDGMSQEISFKRCKTDQEYINYTMKVGGTAITMHTFIVYYRIACCPDDLGMHFEAMIEKSFTCGAVSSVD